ncbi:pca operon transcription factor PcaQ [Tropicimonas isoalkanivorans]|uniref:Transcriptional regulator, LysR family n=1 Tax=Tropicimonas isoalkanivorans TaxID=441112 RepID=A0A1I1PJI8_9RHOB|nr:pca operon transcription factor PcaQ [Tropicimonas isoalkanivorans]SFD09886.1 transcriptional regulator, LysR family [Tropicimonas isoalkanivorans]
MIDRRIKVRHIQCFVEIVRQKSLKRAAERLSLTQPAISKTLKELEEILGTALLIRNRAGVALTRQGEVFLHFAEMSVAALQQGLDGVEQIGSRGSITLSIGALPSVAARLMPEVVRSFRTLAPEITLRITDGPHGYLIDLLRQGRLDLVIGRLGQTDTMQGISFTQLYNEYVEFVVRPGHPLLADPDMRRLSEWPVIFPPEASAIRPLIERVLVAHGVGEIPDRIETVSGAFGRNFTAATDAVWIISAGVVAKEIADGRLVRLPFETALTVGPVGLMSRPDAQPTPAEQMFRKAVNVAVEDLSV